MTVHEKLDYLMENNGGSGNAGIYKYFRTSMTISGSSYYTARSVLEGSNDLVTWDTLYTLSSVIQQYSGSTTVFTNVKE